MLTSIASRTPASFFGMVLGLAGLGGAWRAAHQAWGLPAGVGEGLMLAAGAVWAAVLILYISKWLVARPAAIAEADHPLQCCFIGLAGVATLLIAGGLAPHARNIALGLYVCGLLFTLGFAIWRTGSLWQGGREEGHTTAVLYLPTVAGSFVAATVGSAFGYAELGQYLLGIGIFGWLAIESVLLRRLLVGPALPPPLRPTLGVQLAPPVVGAVALLAVAPQAPPLLAHMMIGYGVLQALVLIRLLPWILKEPFTAAYWAFTFGATALATAPTRLVVLGDTGVAQILAPCLFVLANLTVGAVAAGTLARLVQGRLLPPAPAAAGAS